MRERITMKNKGFSLIELLVAVAIAGIILLMLSIMLVQGTKMFSGESDKIGVRNDYQIVRNQIEQAVMEAKSLVIVRAGEDIVIYTGDVNTANNRLKSEESGGITTERIITFDKSEGKIYISDSYGTAVSEGNLICSTVTEFDISFSSKCLKNDSSDPETGAYYVNPLSVDIKFKMEGQSDGLNSSLSVRVRNVLKEVAIYRTENRSTLLVNATDVVSFKVK